MQQPVGDEIVEEVTKVFQNVVSSEVEANHQTSEVKEDVTQDSKN